jgi:hypothetical protein
MEVSAQLQVLADLSSGGRNPGTHWTGIWVGPRACLDAVVKRKKHVTYFIHDDTYVMGYLDDVSEMQKMSVSEINLRTELHSK